MFSRYPSHLMWSRRGLLTHLAWARCSRSIHHVCHGLVAVFSHALHGFIVLIGGGGRSTGSWVERGRSVERDNIRLRSIALYTTGDMRTSSPFHPRGASIFPCVKILPGLLRGGSTGNVDFLGSEHSCSHFRRIHTSLGLQTFGVLTRLS